jgi:hypothetical protein
MEELFRLKERALYLYWVGIASGVSYPWVFILARQYPLSVGTGTQGNHHYLHSCVSIFGGDGDGSFGPATIGYW